MAFIKRADVKIAHVYKDEEVKPEEEKKAHEEMKKAAEIMEQKVKQAKLEN